MFNTNSTTQYHQGFFFFFFNFHSTSGFRLKGTVFFNLSAVLFIHNDCFGARCRVLQISAIEMSAFSRIQWNLITVGLCQQNKRVETWLFKITIRPGQEQSHIGAIKLENTQRLPELSLGGHHYLLHPTMTQAWASRRRVDLLFAGLVWMKKKLSPHETAHIITCKTSFFFFFNSFCLIFKRRQTVFPPTPP